MGEIPAAAIECARQLATLELRKKYPAGEVLRGSFDGRNECATAFARYIQQVSDAAKEVADQPSATNHVKGTLGPFILPGPVDPLVEICAAVFANGNEQLFADSIGEELTKRGLKIVSSDA